MTQRSEKGLKVKQLVPKKLLAITLHEPLIASQCYFLDFDSKVKFDLGKLSFMMEILCTTFPQDIGLILIHFRTALTFLHSRDSLMEIYWDKWHHITMTFRRFNDGEESRFIVDGGTEYSRIYYTRRYHSTSGRIVIGRRYTDIDDYYASVHLDQLLIFNRATSRDESITLSQISG